jgi:hypothetical protein
LEKKLPDLIAETRKAWTGEGPIRLMFMDEARFGRISDTRRCWCPKPIRPVCYAMVSQEYTYAYAAASVSDDGAGWHKNESLIIPDNIRLLSLPPYSPELNPVEHIWDDLREKEFHNRVFDSIDSLEDHLEKTLHDMEHDQERIRSIVAWPWIINALMN